MGRRLRRSIPTLLGNSVHRSSKSRAQIYVGHIGSLSTVFGNRGRLKFARMSPPTKGKVALASSKAGVPPPAQEQENVTLLNVFGR